MNRKDLKPLTRVLDDHLSWVLSDIVIEYYDPKFCDKCYLLTMECQFTRCTCGKRIKCSEYRCKYCVPCLICSVPLRYVNLSPGKSSMCMKCLKNRPKQRYRCGTYIKSSDLHCKTTVANFHDKCKAHKN